MTAKVLWDDYLTGVKQGAKLKEAMESSSMMPPMPMTAAAQHHTGTSVCMQLVQLWYLVHLACKMRGWL